MDTAQLKTLLARELKFLERSSAAFDAGHHDEAIRIATTIRLMIHQTPKSTSLLTLLGVRDTIKLVTTVKPPPDTKGKAILAIFDGVTTMTINGLEPNLKSIYSRGCWRGGLVESACLGIRSGKQVDSKDHRPAAANKDGGAHVDTNISKEYQDLIEGLWTLTRQDSVGTETRPMTDHQFIALRRFAYELLNSPELLALAR